MIAQFGLGLSITKISGVLSKEWDVKHPDSGDLYNRFYGTEQFKQFDDFFLIYHSPMDSCSMGEYVDLYTSHHEIAPYGIMNL